MPNKITLREARQRGDLDKFIAERDAEKQPKGNASELNRVVRRLTETPKEVRRASRRVRSDD